MIYVTGGKGRLGSELVRLGCIPIECDVRYVESVQESLSVTTPKDILIHCAAYTNVDEAETKDGQELALKVNIRGTDHVRYFHKGRMVLISTDYVFSGKRGPYKENSKVDSPVNAYGWTKWGSETVFSTPFHEGDTIVRTTGLYGGPSGKHDFTKLVIDSLRDGKELQITKSLIGNQTYVPHLAEALVVLAILAKPPRILNLGSKDIISRYEFALMIASIFDLDKELLRPVVGVDGWVAKRPTKGGLRTGLAEKLGLPIYTVKEGLKHYAQHHVW